MKWKGVKKMDKKYENILDRLEILEKNEKIHSVRIQIAKMRDDALLNRVKELEFEMEHLKKEAQATKREFVRFKKAYNSLKDKEGAGNEV